MGPAGAKGAKVYRHQSILNNMAFFACNQNIYVNTLVVTYVFREVLEEMESAAEKATRETL